MILILQAGKDISKMNTNCILLLQDNNEGNINIRASGSDWFLV